MPKDLLSTSEYKDIPTIPAGLIEALERRFPSQCPELSQSERVIFFNAGRCELIAWLKNLQTRRLNNFMHATKETITNV
jgi:hypothetical protein